MDSGLLSCTDSDSLTTFCITYRVGLCIFQCDQRNDQVDFSRIRNFFILCHNISKEIAVDFQLISSLLKSHTKYLFVLNRVRNVVWIDFDDVIFTTFFCFQDFQCFRLVTRSDHTIGNFTFDDFCCTYIANI